MALTHVAPGAVKVDVCVLLPRRSVRLLAVRGPGLINDETAQAAAVAGAVTAAF